ncbi:hypothetical protein KZZ52_08285 [Dactylosporangium sp. AC04546]|uniref:hypothetical protein n=1 Tax=Dactylosporangium sp. AC04546 TaxID=2862460 RepID=UPI001EDE30DF|nr:hypothetical protein [Dactylosporangium sp. AC04546]WVK85374.1 hypothetical protein KZZ52_08285 [Dactylosporangium sp. AC04546]
MLLYAAGLTIALPPLLVLAVAAVLRGGSTLFDRLALAVALLTGLTCLGGLAFAVWPWGLHPVAVAGTAFTALIVTAASCDRRPSLPRPHRTDAVAFAAIAAVATLLTRPLLRDGMTGRLAGVLAGEDLARHATVFDAIRQTGGYLFQQPEAAERLVYRGMVTYPQGSHLLASLIDGFVRSSSGDFGSGTAMLTHYLAYVAGGHVLLTLALVWAARWLGGAGLTPARQLPLVAFVAGMCGLGQLVALWRMGYPSQTAGLAAAVSLLALLARPLSRVREQLLLVSALLVAVGFTYYLYLPPVLAAALVWCWRSRHRLRGHRVAVPVCAVAGVVSAAPMAAGLLLAGQAGALFTVGSLRLGRPVLVALALLVALAFLSGRVRRSRIWRGYALMLTPVAGFAVLLLAAQRLAGAGSGYYANKALFLVFAVLLAGLGAVATAVPADRPRWPAAVALFVAVAGTFAFVGRQHHPTPLFTAADAILRTYARYPSGPTVIVGDDKGYDSYRMTLFLQTLQRTSGSLARATYGPEPVTSPHRLDAVVERAPGPLRLVALSENAERRALEVSARHPSRAVAVVLLD